MTFGLLSSPCLAQNGTDTSIPLSPESYLEYIKAENSAVRAQVTELRKAIEQERKAHYEFVEGIYKWIAIGVGVLAALFGPFIVFLGWNSQKAVRKDLREAMEAIIKQPVILDKLLAIVNDELNLEKGTFYFFADNEQRKALQHECSLMASKGLNVELKAPEASFKGADVLIYRFLPDAETKEDPKLIELLQRLKANKPSLPLVVYAPDGLRIEGETLKVLNAHDLHHIANNRITLINSVASAFRVNQLSTPSLQRIIP